MEKRRNRRIIRRNRKREWRKKKEYKRAFFSRKVYNTRSLYYERLVFTQNIMGNWVFFYFVGGLFFVFCCFSYSFFFLRVFFSFFETTCNSPNKNVKPNRVGRIPHKAIILLLRKCVAEETGHKKDNKITWRMDCERTRTI